MPEPQPAWAQQYNYEMKPIWARKFEPPAIAGDESQEAIETLMEIYRVTGKRKYLEPILRALAYLNRSLLPDGRLARFYELRTNRPLYMSRRGDTYSLTYDDSDLPSHYGWKMKSRLGEIEKRCYRLMQDTHDMADFSSKEIAARVRRVIDDLDSQGRWLSVYDNGPLVGQPKFELNMPYISSAVFSANIELLSDYLDSTRKK
jgi:hypothetical protein